MGLCIQDLALICVHEKKGITRVMAQNTLAIEDLYALCILRNFQRF
jgi:hypothetical protein